MHRNGVTVVRAVQERTNVPPKQYKPRQSQFRVGGTFGGVRYSATCGDIQSTSFVYRMTYNNRHILINILSRQR